MTSVVAHSYTPRGAAKDLFACRDPEVLLSGPAGTGKSRACMEKLHMLALVNPGMRGLIVRKTLASLGSTALVTWREHVVAEAIGTGLVTFYGGSPQESPQYRYGNGSTITIGGLDKPQKIMSSEYDAAYVQEAIELVDADWEAITTRLRNGKVSFQQLLADTNPAQPTHWLKARADRGVCTMIDSRHEDNPTLYHDDGTLTSTGRDYIGKLDALTGVRYLRLRKGLWAAADGIVYEEYDPLVHLVDRFRIPDDWTRYWSVDFGYVHPFVCQMWAEDPDGRLYLYREVYRTKRTVDQHAVDILTSGTKEHPAPTRKDWRYTGERKFAWQGRIWMEPKPRAVICDHDAEGRAVLERELGMSTVPAKKTVSDGIQAVQQRLRSAGDKPRLFLMRDAVVERDQELADAKKPTGTAEEILGYVWDTGAGKKPKDAPLKIDDDGCLVAGTLVATPDGEVPIESVHPGDLVLTRAGARLVVGAGMTDPGAEVWRVGLSNGRTLVGTGDHPVWSRNGWIRLDALRYGDTLEPCPEWIPSGSREPSTAGIPTRRSGRPAATTRRASRTASAGSGSSTRKSGSSRTGRSPMVTRSITSTSTRSTMPSRTWRASRSPSTRKPTANADVSVAAVLTRWRTWPVAATRPPRGTGPTRAVSGIGSTRLSRDSAITTRGRACATSAALSMSTPASTVGSGSARTGARPRPGSLLAWTMNNEPAGSVAQSSRSTDMPAPGAAGVRVLNVCALDTRVPVYNLTVSGQPEFYAEGVLVHNCDSMRYVVAHRDLKARSRIRWL